MPKGQKGSKGIKVSDAPEQKKWEKGKHGIMRKKVVEVSDASDQTTTVPGIGADKAPKFGKSEFHV